MAIAPTSAGKTRVAEMAMARSLETGRKAVYLVPTRALAEEKTAAFETWLGPAHYRVLCATRDRPETDPLVARGEFDVLVAVYEKMNHFLLAYPEMLATIGTLAVDEIQMLAEPRRGGLLDLLLTKVLLSPYKVQIVALGSEMAAPESVAGWLGCQLIIDRRRPRGLREGVLDASTGIFHYRNADTGEDGVESFAPPETLESLARQISEECGGGEPGCSSDSVLLAAAASLALRGEPLLVFAPTRHASRLWARRLASAGLGAPPARLTLPRLIDQERGRANELLGHCLEHGVAFHNADLSARLRSLIEAAFNEGDLRAIVTTPTLGLGVNLAAQNVLHFPWRIATDAESGKPITLPLGRRRFTSHGGRAARLGFGQGEGRSMLVARSKDEMARLWGACIEQAIEPTPPPLVRTPLEMAALDLLAGGIRRSTENVARALGRTFTFCATQILPGQAAPFQPAAIDEALEACRARDLIASEGGLGYWRLTGLGEAAARLGLSGASVASMRVAVERNLLRNEKGEPASAFQCFLLLALTDEGALASAGLAGPSPLLARSLGETLRRPDNGLPGMDAVRRILGSSPNLSSREIRAYYVARALDEWVGGTPTREIEEKFNTFQGSLGKVGGEFAWLLGGLAAVASAFGAPEAEVLAIRQLAERTPIGISETCLPLVRLHISRLGRSAMASLLREGWGTPETLCDANGERLAEMLGDDLASELVAAARKALRVRTRRFGFGVREFATTQASEPSHITPSKTQEPAPSEPASQQPPALTSPSPAPPVTIPASVVQAPATPAYLLEINLLSPGVIRAKGREIALPPLSFELLAALAERAGEVVTRASLYTRLWPEDEDGPEEQPLDGHRRKLIRRLQPYLGREAGKAAEVIRGIGFRFALPHRLVSFRRA